MCYSWWRLVFHGTPLILSGQYKPGATGTDKDVALPSSSEQTDVHWGVVEKMQSSDVC